MKNLITNYSFNVVSKEITITTPNFVAEIERVVRIVNLTTNTPIYDVAYNMSAYQYAQQLTCVDNKIVCSYLPSGMQSTDKLLIEYDFFFDLEKAMEEYLDKNGYSRKTNQIISDVSIGNTLTETTIYQFQIKANEFKQKENILLNLFGRFSKPTTTQIIIRIKINCQVPWVSDAIEFLALQQQTFPREIRNKQTKCYCYC